MEIKKKDIRALTKEQLRDFFVKEGDKSKINDLIKSYEYQMSYFPTKTKKGKTLAKIAQVKYDNSIGTKMQQYLAFDNAYKDDAATFTSPKSLYTYFSLAVDLYEAGEKPVEDVFDLYEIVYLKIENEKFEIGKAIKLTEGTDVTIVATGHLVWEALQASEQLEAIGISAEVINIHTIKPLDEDAILASVAKTKCVVTAEEHNILGGLGESVARTLSLNNPVPQEYVAVNDQFGESGTPAQLMEKYKLNDKAIVAAVKRVLERK